MEKTVYGVIEPPKDLVLRKDETIEWYVVYEMGRYPFIMKDDCFIIHCNTSEEAEKGVMEKFPGARVRRIEYLGTYQY